MSKFANVAAALQQPCTTALAAATAAAYKRGRLPAKVRDVSIYCIKITIMNYFIIRPTQQCPSL